MSQAEQGREELEEAPEAPLDLSLDEGYVLSQMIQVIAGTPSPSEELYSRSRRTAFALLELRYGRNKLLFSRRDVLEIFRRQAERSGATHGR